MTAGLGGYNGWHPSAVLDQFRAALRQRDIIAPPEILAGIGVP